jgi:hypothetical protein
MRCYENVKFHSFDPMIGEIGPSLSSAEFDIEPCAERHTSPAFVSPVWRGSLDLDTHVIDGESFVSGARNFYADDGVAMLIAALQSERKSGSGGLQGGVQRYSCFLRLRRRVLLLVNGKSAIFVFLRFDWRITRVQNSRAVSLCRPVGEHLVWCNRSYEVLHKTSQDAISKQWSAHRENRPLLRKKK